VPGSYRESIKTLATSGLHWSGALRAAQAFSHRFEVAALSSGRQSVRRAREPKFAIICHHRIGNGGVPYYSSFSPEAFEKQIRFLRRNYRIVSMDELCRGLDERDSGAQAVAITFDDGYRDIYTQAFPILQQYKIPAMVYLTAAAIERGEVSWYDRVFAVAINSRRYALEIDVDGPRRFILASAESRMLAAIEIVKTLRGCSNRERVAACAELENQGSVPAVEVRNRMLTWQQIHEMRKAGISFGAHTMNHPVVRRLDADERQEELGKSKLLLEDRLQHPVEHFAYPFGSVSDIDAETCSLMPGFGYRSAVSTAWGINEPNTNRFLLRRIGGEVPALPRFSFYLRQLFLCAPQSPTDLQSLEQAVQYRMACTESATAESGQLAEVHRA
jgi:peptidoglycan/xylan/chitin deacetylase (PgdA/CDA1 family)